MAKSVQELSDDELDNVIDNHRNKRATDSPYYIEALAEQAKRKGKGLDFETTISVIKEAARQGRYISYGEVAKASGAEWNKVYHAIGPHLDRLIEFCHLNDIPLLSSIVVNQPNIDTGRLEPDSLRGFIAGVRGAGIVVTDEEGFLRAAQAAVFAWARATRQVGS